MYKIWHLEKGNHHEQTSLQDSIALVATGNHLARLGMIGRGPDLRGERSELQTHEEKEP